MPPYCEKCRTHHATEYCPRDVAFTDSDFRAFAEIDALERMWALS